MGKTADHQDTADRSRSWARSLTWAKTPSNPLDNTTSDLPITEPKPPLGNANGASLGHDPYTTNPANNALDARSNNNNSNDYGNTIKSPVPANTASPVFPPSADTKAQGEKSATIDPNGTVIPNGNQPKLPLGQRAKAGSKRFWNHTKNAIFHSWINLLLIFVPIGIIVRAIHTNPTIIFAMNAVAIVPLAGLLAHATESVASRLGDTLGALLNVSFGNAVELIIFMYVNVTAIMSCKNDLHFFFQIRKLSVPVIALVKNEINIVQASLLGSILSNLLLILGMAFAAGGLRFQEQIYNNTVTQMSAVMLSLSVMSLLLPTAFHATFSDTAAADRNTLKISRGTSVVLLLVYILYLIFQLKSHAYLYNSLPQAQIDEESHPGVLADFLDSSTSSSSSSSSSSDTDSTSGSHTTAKKRIKRFIRKRRKSSASSNDTHSFTASQISSPITEGVSPPTYFNESEITAHRGHGDLPNILSGDEGDNEIRHHQVKTHDFGSAVPFNSQSPERKIKTKAKKSSNHKHHKAAAVDGLALEAELATVTSKPQTSEPAEYADIIAPHAGTIDAEQPRAGTPNSRKGAPGLTMSFTRPGLPKLLSHNVFVTPQANPSIAQTPGVSRSGSGPKPAVGPRASTARTVTGLRRVNSLPDRLNERSTSIPGNRQSPHWVQPTGGSLPPHAARGAWAARVKTDPPPTSNATEVEKATMSRTAAVVMLLIATGLVAICAEFLVDAIPEMTESSGVSQAFIGVIILPIVGNAAEHMTAVAVAYKNKMDLAIGVAVGSSIQIALFVTPIIVLLGWCMDKDMSLYFNLFETVSLFVTVFVVNFLVLDGKSNYLEGVLLIAAYIIIAVAAFFYPSTSQQSALGGFEAP